MPIQLILWLHPSLQATPASPTSSGSIIKCQPGNPSQPSQQVFSTSHLSQPSHVSHQTLPAVNANANKTPTANANANTLRTKLQLRTATRTQHCADSEQRTKCKHVQFRTANTTANANMRYSNSEHRSLPTLVFSLLERSALGRNCLMGRRRSVTCYALFRDGLGSPRGAQGTVAG